QQELAGAAREMLAIYRKNQDLINIGAYPTGSNAAIDRAIQLHEPLRQFLRQAIQEGFTPGESWGLLGRTLARMADTKPGPPPPAAPPPPPPPRQAGGIPLAKTL